MSGWSACELDFFGDSLTLIMRHNFFGESATYQAVPGSDAEVQAKAAAAEAFLQRQNWHVGVWEIRDPFQTVDLTIRPDGQFRLARCQDGGVARDYGLYTVNLAARTLVYDSRFSPVQTHGLDFYGDTLTIYGGNLGDPNTYAVNLGRVDAAIEASLAAGAICFGPRTSNSCPSGRRNSRRSRASCPTWPIRT